VRSYNPDEIDVQFDDGRLVADAGLILPATLAVGLGLRELLGTHVDLGEAPGRANVADKAMTLLHSALAGGSWIDDCDRLRAGSTGSVLGHRVFAPPRSARSCGRFPSAMPVSWTPSAGRRLRGPGSKGRALGLGR
jgi:hypothetical protein